MAEGDPRHLWSWPLVFSGGHFQLDRSALALLRRAPHIS
jgi:hypothetical protein